MPQVTTRYGAPARPGARPLVTFTIIGICAVVYAGQLIDDRVTEALAFWAPLAVSEPWRFVTAAFAHSPSFVMHILFNMYALWLTGQYLEPMLGRARFVALYLISAVGGSVGYLLLAQLPSRAGEVTGWLIPTVGASGAVFGLFAAVFVLNRHLGRQSTGILVILGINTVLGFVVPNIAWQAHLGGALTGAAIAGLLALTSPQGRDPAARARRRWHWPGILAVLAVLVALALWRLYAVHSVAPWAII